MLLLASIALASSSWALAPNCPGAFSSVNTTIGAISDSAQLTLCAAKAILIKGSNGSLNLVIGSQVSTAPRCLTYPNGLSLDLTYDLLSSGRVGCWSLYPPNQAIAIVNVGKPSRVKLQSALKSFKPEIPRVFYKPSKGIEVGTQISLSSSARAQILKTKLLNMAAQVRFRPTRYSWRFVSGTETATSSLSNPKYVAPQQNDVEVLLAVSYSVEYLFVGVTNWNLVKPDLVVNAYPVSFSVESSNPPNSSQGPPRLVNSPCASGSSAWRC